MQGSVQVRSIVSFDATWQRSFLRRRYMN